jgi:electron transfer flavoprotein beta subunit
MKMNVLVCVKQVPDTTEIKIDPETNTLIRAGVPSIVNPFDAYALEAAARIKDKNPETKIVVACMGPEQAKEALKECLAIAADKAYLISGRKFGGSDTLATSYILSQAVKKLEEAEGKFDAIFCGKQAIDGDTAQVGPEIAEHLGYPQVTYALEAEADGGRLKVKKEVEDGALIIGVETPCLVTFTKPAWDPRHPSIKRKMTANRAEIPTFSEEDLPSIDLSKAGLKGSPTKVKKTFVPQKKTGGVKLREETAAASARKLYTLLDAAGII